MYFSEFSTIDTTILVLGALFAGNYFGGEVENLALQLRDATQWSDAIKLVYVSSLHFTYLLCLEMRPIPEYTLRSTGIQELSRETSGDHNFITQPIILS